nr:putative nucleoprotein [Filoviridae sp.]
MSTDDDTVTELLSTPRGGASGVGPVGGNGTNPPLVFHLAGPYSQRTGRILNACWLCLLTDPNPPPIVVQVLSQVTLSCFFNVPADAIAATQAILGENVMPMPVEMTRFGEVTIPKDAGLETMMNSYLSHWITVVQPNQNDWAWVAYKDGLQLWQVMLIHIILCSGHMFTGNSNLVAWYQRRRTALLLNTAVTMQLSSGVLQGLSCTGGSLIGLRGLVVACVVSAQGTPASGSLLISGVLNAASYVRWAGMAWVYLALNLVLRTHSIVLLLPHVRTEAMAFLTAVRALGPERTNLQFARMLSSPLAHQFSAGSYPALSSAAYGVASATFSSFSGFSGRVFCETIYKVARRLTLMVTAVDLNIPDSLTQLSGPAMERAVSQVNDVLKESSGGSTGKGPGTV